MARDRQRKNRGNDFGYEVARVVGQLETRIDVLEKKIEKLEEWKGKATDAFEAINDVMQDMKRIYG